LGLRRTNEEEKRKGELDTSPSSGVKKAASERMG